MGKASQSKKVARAARAAGPTRPNRRRWLWPGVLALVLVFGGVVIVMSRRDSNPAPAQTITNESTTTTTPAPSIPPDTTPGVSTGSSVPTGSATVTTAAPGAASTTTPAGASTTSAPSP